MTPLTIWVLDQRVSIMDDDKPLAGVTVLFDPPAGGEKVKKTTEADGHVTFEADFTKGGAAVTVASPDHVLFTLVDVAPDRVYSNGIGKPASDAVVFPPRQSGDEALSVSLQGTLTRKRDPASTVDLSASAIRRLGSLQTTTASYMLRAPRGRPFFLLAHETKTVVNEESSIENQHLASFRFDVAARTADGALDLDLGASTPLAVRTVHLRADMPSGGAFGAGSRGSAIAVSADSELLVGALQKAKPSADGKAFDLEIAAAGVDIAPERVLTRATLVAADGARSSRTEQGLVADGTRWSDFPAPPLVPDGNRGLEEPIPLDGFPQGADLRVDIVGAGRLLWIVRGPPGGFHGSSLLLPPLPDDRFSVLRAMLVLVSVSAQLDRVLLPSSGEIYRRVSSTHDIPTRSH